MTSGNVAAATERPRFQFSLGTLLQVMTVVSLQLTLFVVSPLVGALTLLVHVPALWRTAVAIRVDRKRHGQTPVGVRIVLYGYSLFLFSATYFTVFGLGWVAIKIADFCFANFEHTFGFKPVGRGVDMVVGVLLFVIPFVLVICAYAFLYWSWPREKSTATCANPANTGN